MMGLDMLIDIFRPITQFSFEAKSTLGTNGWNGVGEGEVKVVQEQENVLIFEEKGFFITPQHKKISCRNVYRWTFQKGVTQENITVQLEHLRFGMQNPVFLFLLVPTNPFDWVSACPRLCDKGAYHANMILSHAQIMLVWRINGEKDETISYLYK